MRLLNVPFTSWGQVMANVREMERPGRLSGQWPPVGNSGLARSQMRSGEGGSDQPPAHCLRVWNPQATARSPVPMSRPSAASTPPAEGGWLRPRARLHRADLLAHVPLEPLCRAKGRHRPVAMLTCWRASSRPSALSPPDLVAVDEIKENPGVAWRLIFPVISSMRFSCLNRGDCLNKSGNASAACQRRSLPPSCTLKCYVSETGDSPMARPSVSPGAKRKPICSGLRNEHLDRHGADRHEQRADLQPSS